MKTTKAVSAAEAKCQRELDEYHEQERKRREERLARLAPELIDLRNVCRDKTKIVTEVTLYKDYERFPWMTLGQCRLRKRDNHHIGETWELAAYLANATDFEHDSAFAMRMELVGVKFEDIEYGRTTFSGWIRTHNLDSFHVPDPGYNPIKHPDTVICKNCDERHPIVPEGFYVPRPNPELYEKVTGLRVSVSTGIVFRTEGE